MICHSFSFLQGIALTLYNIVTESVSVQHQQAESLAISTCAASMLLSSLQSVLVTALASLVSRKMLHTSFY